jgi:ketosteroid isomerase-like protein
MENKNIETVKRYFEGWATGMQELLSLAPNLRFTSPDDNFSSSADFLARCWKYHGMKYDDMRFIAEGNNVCVRYKVNSDGKQFENSEWITLDNGLITEINVFYGNK